MEGLAAGECRLDARQIGILAQGGRVSALVGRDDGRGQVSGIRIMLVAVPDSPPVPAMSAPSAREAMR